MILRCKFSLCACANARSGTMALVRRRGQGSGLGLSQHLFLLMQQVRHFSLGFGVIAEKRKRSAHKTFPKTFTGNMHLVIFQTLWLLAFHLCQTSHDYLFQLLAQFALLALQQRPLALIPKHSSFCCSSSNVTCTRNEN